MDFKNGCESLKIVESWRYGVKWYFVPIGRKWVEALILLTRWRFGCKSEILSFGKADRR